MDFFIKKGNFFLKEWKWLNADFRAKSKKLKNHNSKLIQNHRDPSTQIESES